MGKTSRQNLHKRFLIAIWWCKLFSWKSTIKINNFEIIDLHMLIHASVRTQEKLIQHISKLFSCGVQTSGHRKITFMGGRSLEHICTSNTRKKCPIIVWGGMVPYMTLQKGTDTHVQLHQPEKRWLEEAEAQVSEIKSKGLDPTCGWSSKAGPTGKKSHHPIIHR